MERYSSRKFDLKSLEWAMLVEEAGSFRGAAHRLSVRASVVSRTIRSLEDEIGVSLFSRTSKGIHITIAGASILKRGRAILFEIGALKMIAALNGRGRAVQRC